MESNFSHETQPSNLEVGTTENKNRRTEIIKDLQRKLNEERSSMTLMDRRKNMAQLMDLMTEEFEESSDGIAEVAMHNNIIQDATFESRMVGEAEKRIDKEDSISSGQ